MPATTSTIAAKDGAGATVAGGIQAQDKSGTGAGPFFATQAIVDAQGANVATVTAVHNTDNQILSGTQYGLVTGGVAQVVNAAGNLNRQRETSFDNIPAAGIAIGTQQLAGPLLSTTYTGAGITANAVAQNAVLAAVSFTNRGVVSTIQVGSELLFDAGLATQEAVYVSAINVATRTITATFTKNHATNATVSTFTYNQARDGTVLDGATTAGMAANATFFYNSALNGGAGGVEIERSFLGELNGATGAGANIAAEFEDSAGGPVLASGVVSGLRLLAAQNLNGKGRGTAAITASVAGNTSVVFGSAAATNTIPAGHALYLSGGATSEVVFTALSWVPGSSATVPLQSPVVNAGQNSAAWDVFAANGPGINGFTAFGIGIEEEALWDPVSQLYYLERSSTQDAMPPQNIVAEGAAIYNGATYDRARVANADAMPVTGIPGATDMLWNGASYDRPRSATADALAITGVPAEAAMVWNGATFDRMREANSDALPVVGIAAEAAMVWNGVSFDRLREATADALPVAGIAGEAAMVWNGASFDRLRGATADALAATGIAFEAPAFYNGTTFDRGRSAGVGNNVAATGIAAEAAYGQFNTVLPTLTTGNYAAIQLDSSGRLILAPNSPSTALFIIPSSNTDTAALITHTAASVGVNGTDQINTSAHGINVVVNITAIAGTTPSLIVTLQGKDIASGVYYNILTSAALTAVGTTILTVFPGATAAANSAANAILPRTWRVISTIAGTTPAVTATVGASVIA